MEYIKGKSKKRKIKPRNYLINLKEKTYTSLYSERYGISTLSLYPQKIREEGDEEDEEENNLESLIKKLDEELEEKLGNLFSSYRLEDIIKKNNKDYIINNSHYIPQKENKNEKIISYKKFLSYRTFYNIGDSNHINQKSGAQVFYVDPSALPSNVLGMYIPSEHTILISNNLAPKEKEFVYYHEEYHSLYGAGEPQADAYAAARTGFNLRQSA